MPTAAVTRSRAREPPALARQPTRLPSGAPPRISRRCSSASCCGGMTQGLAADGPLGGGDDPFAAMLRDEYGKLIAAAAGSASPTR